MTYRSPNAEEALEEATLVKCDLGEVFRVGSSAC
jgi:hypothetical protein